MVPSGPSTPMGNPQSVPPSLLRSNSGLMGAQGGSIPSQGGFPSLLSPRNQFGNVNLLGNVHQPFGNGVTSPALSGADSDPMGSFNPSSSFQGQQFMNHSGNPMQSISQQHDQHPQQQFQAMRGVGPVKMESQGNSDQLQSLRGLSSVKLEPQPQQIQSMRSLPPVKMEPQNSEQSMFLHQQQQQQQQQLLRQSSQAAAAVQLNLLQQQRLLQIQQQQQQQRQLMNALPQQRSQMQQQFQAQNLQMRPPVKQGYEVGMCAKRVTQYMFQQQNRPEDNNIEFWRKFVDDFFAPNAKKKWCVSMYGNGRQTTGVFPQDAWHCEICNRKPGRGFEATVEVLPRLFKIKYESGTMEELLYVDMPREYHNPSGQIVLDYSKAIQESVFEQLRVVRDGQLRIVFSPDLKICSWEFCARRHEELIPRRLLIPQVSQLGNAAQKYQAASQNNSTNLSVADLQNTCNMFVASAKLVAKALEVPLVNDLGYTKRYVRCLQISEVVNSMKDLIDYSRITGTGPMESLAKYPRRTNQQPPEDQQQQQQNPSSNGIQATSNSHNTAPASAMPTLVHQNSMNSRPQNPMTNPMASPSSSSSMQPPPPIQQNSSPFHSPTPPPSNTSPLQQQQIAGDGDPPDSQSSVQKIIQEMMITSQINGSGGMMGNGMKQQHVNGLMQSSNSSSLNGPTCLVGNSLMNSGYSGMNSISQAAMMNGVRAAMGNNNSMLMNGRVAMATMGQNQHQQQQDQGSQMLSGLAGMNGFNNLQFDWKQSP